MSLSFNSAQRGGIINIITYCEECVWPYVHIRRQWGSSKRVEGPAETALMWHGLAGVSPPDNGPATLGARRACLPLLPPWARVPGSSWLLLYSSAGRGFWAQLRGALRSPGSRASQGLITVTQCPEPRMVVLLQARRSFSSTNPGSPPLHMVEIRSFTIRERTRKKDAEKRGLPSRLQRFPLSWTELPVPWLWSISRSRHLLPPHT